VEQALELEVAEDRAAWSAEGHTVLVEVEPLFPHKEQASVEIRAAILALSTAIYILTLAIGTYNHN